MKYGDIRHESRRAQRRTAAAALVTFFVTFLFAFVVLESSVVYAPNGFRASVSQTIGKIFCRVGGVVAPMPYLRCGSPARRFDDLRRQVAAAVGFDFLATLGDMKRNVNARSSKPGVAFHSQHKNGLAFDYNQEDERLLLVREEIAGRTYWRTYLLCARQDGTCGVKADLDTDNAGRVSAFVFDFTAAAEGLGWKRIPAQEGWEYTQTKKEFWHYETAENVAVVTTDSVAETKPGGDQTKEGSLITAPLRWLAKSVGWTAEEKPKPPPNDTHSTPVTESRGGNDGPAKRREANRPTPSPRTKAGATPAPPASGDR